MTVRREIRRWLWRHPWLAVRRSLAWCWYKRIPPWKQTATMVALINPRPLSPEKLALLRKRIQERLKT